MARPVDVLFMSLFALGFLIPFYTYFVFPALVALITCLRSRSFVSDADFSPAVTLLISAYNEAGVIERKLANTLALEYPADKLRVMVLDDGSTDGTGAIVQAFTASGIEFHRFEGRVGKNEALNRAFPLVRSEIVVFSDANALYEPQAIRRLVAHFADARIGCVCGELRYVSAETGSALGEDLYWKYEQFIKRVQSRMGEVLVLNGSIFAIRRNLFRPLQPKVANDFQIPIAVASQGYAIVYEPEAVAVEKVAANAEDEFARKARIVARGFEGFFRELGNLRGFRLFQFISQKFLRWNVWAGQILMLVSSAALLHLPLFRWLFGAQVVFYLLACLGPLINRLRVPGLAIPYYFCIINAAAIIGLWRYLTGKQRATWEPPVSAR